MAFCFYNLSSIINGLVYFDQFSLLSTTHLCLVLAGMVILLAGVWIVSLPPSGGIGVDVTRWDEQHSAARGDDEAVEVYEDEPLPMVPPRTSYTEPSTPTLERSSDEENAHAGLGIITLDNGSGLYGSLHTRPSPTKGSPHARRQTDSALLAQSKPSSAHPPQRISSPEALPRPRPRATSTLPPSTSLSSQNTQTIHAIPQRQSTQTGHYAYPFPLSPGATPGTLGGFSIGLSPMSPGFALVPRRKGRRTGSIAGEGLSPPTGDTNSRRLGRSPQDPTAIRRVVSDGGVHPPPRPSGSYDEERAWLLDGEGHEEAALRGGRASPGEGTPLRGGRSRWKWLRGVLSLSR